MCSQLLDPSWPECALDDLFPYEGYPHTMNIEFLEMDESDFLFSLTNTEDSHTKSSLAPSSPSLDYISCVYLDGNLQSSNGAFMDDDHDQFIEITQGIILDNHKESIGDICRWMNEISGDSPLRSPSLSISSSTSPGGEQEVRFEQHSLVLPTENIEFDNQLSIIHLLKACGEAKEKEYVELEEVIHRRVIEKSMPVGETLERLGYYCCSNEKQTDYLKQESNKNYEVAFRAFYEMCPYGRFAHFTANRAILEAIPNDAEKVHILDFDMGEGVQWPPLLQSLNGREVRITAVRWKEEERRSCSFHETSRRLCEYSKSRGLRLRVEEIEMEELPMLFAEKKRKRKRGSESIREWVAANCMVDLPHMASARSRRQALNFLVTVAAADDSIGILTFGSGEVVVGESSYPGSSSSSFGSYFEGSLVHFHALLESMEWHLPSSNLSLARTAMECLFVAPNVSLHACFLQWKEGTSEGFGGQCYEFELLANGFKSRPLSIGNLEEARHLVYSGMEGGMYGVKVMSPNGNEMVLEWRGTPLVRISAWKR